MIPAEFEEPAYEAPLYNQLERGLRDIYTPGRVLEQRLGFDRGIYLAEHLVWDTLGFRAPPQGIALAYYDWPTWFGPASPPQKLPRFRLNIFLQAKRSRYHSRRPRALKEFPSYAGPLWSFEIKEHQQRLLLAIAEKAGRRAFVAYAGPVFHTVTDLFRHTRDRTIVLNSTFPTAKRLSNHETWYYVAPGTVGVANPEPELIEEPPFPQVLDNLAAEAPSDDTGDLLSIDRLASDVIAAVQEGTEVSNAYAAHFLDDLQTLDRNLEPFALRPTIRAFAQIRLFTIRFGLSWLVHSGPRAA